MTRASCCAWLLFCSCGDPLHEQGLEALGAEDPRVEPGPLHRPGQPCGACHAETGPAVRAFSLSGTVFRDGQEDVPLPSAEVRVIDSTGAQLSTFTNCAGNFFVTSAEYLPRWPIWMKVELGEVSAEMRSAASRESSCAACHAADPGPSSVGRVFLHVDDDALDSGACTP